MVWHVVTINMLLRLLWQKRKRMISSKAGGRVWQHESPPKNCLIKDKNHERMIDTVPKHEKNMTKRIQ